MAHHTSKQSRLTPCTGSSTLFVGDVLVMNGGKLVNEDLRPFLLKYLEGAEEEVVIVNKSKDTNYGGYQTILRLGGDGLLEIYNPTAMMSIGHELTRQQGHFTVPSSGRGNRIWDGKFVVEYDLIDVDGKGRKYLFMDGNDIAKVRDTRKENEEMGDCADAIDTDDEEYASMVAAKVARLNENKGPVVSGSSLLTEIKMLAELYREETESLEKVCCLDPAMRRLLLPALPEGTPMFKVAFLTNVMCMGFKAVFYPTILEHIDTTTTSTAVIDAILALQTRLLEDAMPKICRSVEDIIKRKRCVKFFKLDVGGTSNLSLPANVKDDRFAVPYHQFKVHHNGVVSISNKELVTTLGVKKRDQVFDWLEKLTEFDTKSRFSKTLSREERGSEWRRNLLFSDVAVDIPFRQRAALIDLDYYVSGLCFSLLNSEYGLCVDMDGEGELNHLLSQSRTTKTVNVATSGLESGSGGASTTFEGVLASNDAAAASMSSTPTDSFFRAYDELRRSAGECPLLSQGVTLDLTKRVYNDMVSSNRFFLLLMALYNEEDKELGIVTNDGVEGFATTIKNVITAKTKAAKKRVAENVFVDKLGLVRSVIDTRIVDGAGDGKYSLALAYGVFQMVLRSLIRDRGIPFSDIQEIASNVANLKWENLDLQDLWEKLHAEETNKPSAETDRLTAERLAEAAASETVQDEEIRGDRLGQLINDINENRETEESIILRDKTIEKLGRDHDYSPFASSANGNDTMFLWTVVTFAERFCHLYNAVNNPSVYYRDMVGEYGLSFAGGLENFETLCRAIKSELDVFISAAGAKPPVFACRDCTKILEKRYEKAKNRVNKDLLAMKKKELEMTTPSSYAVPVTRSEMSTDEQYVYKVHTDELYRSMFDCLSKEEDENNTDSNTEDDDDSYESGGEDEDFGEEEEESVVTRLGASLEGGGHGALLLKDDVISDFFKRYSEVRSFKNRSALCHRQGNVMIKSLLIMDKFLAGYVVTPKVIKHQDDPSRILEEVRERSKKGRDWTIPYTFPVRDVEECSCHDSIRLLTVPESNSTRQLTSAMRFSTMACERKFFADVSHSLGFVRSTDAAAVVNGANETEYLFSEPSLDIYKEVIVPEQRLRECLLPRTRARYSRDTYDASLINLEKYASFFTGLWSLCAKANLENTVLSAVVSSPQEASSLLMGTSSADRRKANGSAVKVAINTIGSRKDLSVCATLLELTKCVEMTEMGEGIDRDFFFGLSRRYNNVRDCNGVHMWNLLDNVKNCFNDSLPVDWRKHLSGGDTLLNLVPNAPDTDESGMIFETCRFLSRCTELMMGSGYGRLSQCLSRDEWRSLLLQATSPSWIGRMALVYEKVMNMNDSRTTESFVNSSAFLTNNNVNKKLSINETKHDKIRFACWEDTETLSLEERIDLLMAVERTNSKMTFSTALLSCVLYRLLIDGERVEDLAGRSTAPNTDKFVPIVKCLSIVNASWGPEHKMNGQLVYIEKCAERGRFENIEEDPLFFYRFAAYVLGMRANNDQFFEELMGTVTESFDFNGVDTRNWTDFIEKHFVSFLLGRRAFLVSRPSAFIKRVIGRGSSTDDDTSESLRRLAKLILVKSVDSDELTVSDLVMCCIDETDVTASSAEEYHAKFNCFGKKIAKSTSSVANMASSACSTEQLSKKLKSSRPNDIRVQFNKKPDINTIERDEEAEADLSYGLYSDTVERAVIRPDKDEKRINGEGGVGRGASPPYRKRTTMTWKEDKGGPNGRTEDFFDHGSRDDTAGTMTGYANSIGSNSNDERFFVKENDLLMRKTTDFSNEDIIIAADNISKLARKLKRQDKIKENICQMIDNITHNLNISCPISEHDDPREFCLTKKAASRLMATVREWNNIVKAEAEQFKEECKEVEKTSSYDMKLVLCGDYNAGNMGGPSDEIHVFKNPLAKRKKKPQCDEEDDDCFTEKWSKKGGGGRRGGAVSDNQQQQQPPEDEQQQVAAVAVSAPAPQDASSSVEAFVRKAQEEYTERHTGFDDGATAVLFKQRLENDKLLDTSILAGVFSSNFIDPYKRSVVPGLMQHIVIERMNEMANKSNKKRKGGNNEDQRNHYAFSSLNVIRVNGELSRTDQCSNRYNKLSSLYDNVSEEQQVNGVSDIITKEDVRVSLRTTDASGEDDYATVKNLWLCNSGIHPRDQVEMFKKMSFRNYNKIWLRMYEEAINMFRKWGVIKKSTIDKPYFCVKYTNMPANVTDTNPPNAVLHSKFLSKPDLVDRITATHPLIKLRDLYVQSMSLSDSERFRYMSTPLGNLDDAILNKAILCREFMTSMYDEKGTFVTSKFTNSAVLMFTPGTSTEGLEGLEEDYDFVGREQTLNTNSFDSYHSAVIEALRRGVFDTSYNEMGRMLRVYDNDMVAINGSAVNVVGLPDSSSARRSEYATKKAVRDTVKDNNHATTVKYSVFGHLTSSFSALNANYNARNILMRIRKLDREAAGIKGGENGEWTANDMSIKYIFGRMRGYVFFGDEFPRYASASRLAVASKCFDCLRESPKDAIFSKDWYTISLIPDLNRTCRLSDTIRACLKVDKKLDVGAEMTVTSPPQSPRQLSGYLSAVDKKTASDTRGVSFLANPVITLKWFLTRGHHLRLSCTNNGVASLSNFMGNRENKRTLEDLPPSSRGLATSFKMKTSRNSCISVDSNRFFLVNGTYLLGGRLEGVNLTTDMFVRCKLHTEKIIVQGALFDANTSIAFLASCVEGTSETRGLPMIEHISRLVNVTSSDAHMKNYWSVDKDDVLTEEDKEIVDGINADSASAGTGVLKTPSVCVDDENYIFLNILHSIVEDLDKKTDKNAVEDHLSRALKKTYNEVVDQRTGMPNMHSLFYLKSLMNFCGYICGVCTGDGEKMHHLLHALSAIGLNMTPKMAMCIVGEQGNNLKSSVINIVKAAWWDKHADMGVEAFVGKGDASSTDAKLAYVAGKMMIYIMEEIGYQGSATAAPLTAGLSPSKKDDNNEEKLDAIRGRNIEIACGLWDRTVERIKTNGASASAAHQSSKKRARNTDGEDGYPTSITDSTPRVINYISDRVGWWSHVKGHVLTKIDRDKILASFVAGPDVPFCTSSGSILDDSPWVRRTDLVLSRSDDMLGIETSPAAQPSEIRKDAIDEIKRKPGTNRFRPFKESLEMMKTRLGLATNVWSVDERQGLLVEPNVAGVTSGTSPTVYALHAFNPLSVSNTGLSSRNFRKRLVDSSSIDAEDVGPILSHPGKSCKEIILPPDDSTSSIIKPTVEQTIAHVLNNPGRYGFPCVSIDGIELFNINKTTPERVLSKVAKGGALKASPLQKEIIALLNVGEDATTATSGEDASASGIDPLRTIETFAVMFNNFDDGTPTAASSASPSWSKNTAPLNLKERSLLAAIESVKPNSIFSDSNKASSKMNKDSPMTKDMLPGQVSSNKLKQIASTDSTMSVRGLHGRPFTCSASATPVMISNSYLLKFYVDVAMYKRMLIFPFETNFAAKNIEPNVDLGDRIVNSGLKVVHAFLLSKRTELWNSTSSTNRQRIRLGKRLEEWNTLTGTNYSLNDTKKFMAVFPSVFLEHVKSTKVLELSDNSNMIKLEEAANTFFQTHSSTVMLSARPNTLIKDESSSAHTNDYSGGGGGGGDDSAHRQMCIINPKNMDTLQRCVDRSKTKGVWGLVNSVLRPVLFVDLPFVDTDMVYGERSTLKLKAAATTFNVGFGVKIPDIDGGKGDSGLIGVGESLMKQLMWSWGATNVKNVMYSCHHLHMMFELVIQETNACKKLHNVGDMTSDSITNVAFMLMYSIYIDMFEKYGAFISGDGKEEGPNKKQKRVQDKASAPVTEKEEGGKRRSYPIYPGMIINKTMKHINNMSNLADMKDKTRCHSAKIANVMRGFEKKLDPRYLCDECIKYSTR